MSRSAGCPHSRERWSRCLDCRRRGRHLSTFRSPSGPRCVRHEGFQISDVCVVAVLVIALEPVDIRDHVVKELPFEDRPMANDTWILLCLAQAAERPVHHLIQLLQCSREDVCPRDDTLGLWLRKC